MSKINRLLGVLLFPLPIIYTAIIWLRNKLYDWGVKKNCPVSRPTISIGNIQLGGTGKTPLVAYTAKLLQELGEEPVVLSRGYGRRLSEPVVVKSGDGKPYSPWEIGDEPLMLHLRNPELLLGIHANRCEMVQILEDSKLGSVYLLDDAFQHRKIQRNLDIVLIDVSRWSRVPFLFPLSYLRDVKSSLRRAGAFVLTKGEQVLEKQEKLAFWLKEKFQKPIFFAEFKPTLLVSLQRDKTLNLNALEGKKIAAFCGIANPGPFFESLRRLGARLVWKHAFKDHHDYSEDDLKHLDRNAFEKGAFMLVTTEKDAVKIRSLNSAIKANIFFLKLEVSLSDEKGYKKLIQSVL